MRILVNYFYFLKHGVLLTQNYTLYLGSDVTLLLEYVCLELSSDGFGYPKFGVLILENEWSNELKASWTRNFFIFLPYLMIFSKSSALWNFEKSSNLQKMKKISESTCLQAKTHFSDWLRVPANLSLLGTRQWFFSKIKKTQNQ